MQEKRRSRKDGCAMKKKDYVLIAVMLLIPGGFSLLGGPFYVWHNSAVESSPYLPHLAIAITVLKCLFFALTLAVIDVVRRNFGSSFLRTWSALLFCALPIASSEILVYTGGFNNWVPDIIFSLLQWGDLAFLFVLIIIVWTLYQFIVNLIQNKNRLDSKTNEIS
jgi:hypothetical protein